MPAYWNEIYQFIANTKKLVSKFLEIKVICGCKFRFQFSSNLHFYSFPAFCCHLFLSAANVVVVFFNNCQVLPHWSTFKLWQLRLYFFPQWFIKQVTSKGSRVQAIPEWSCLTPCQQLHSCTHWSPGDKHALT